MIVVLIDDSHVESCPSERLRGGQSAKSPPMTTSKDWDRHHRFWAELATMGV